MRALRALLPGMAFTAMLGAFALTTGFSPPTVACAATPAAQNGTEHALPAAPAASPDASAPSSPPPSAAAPASPVATPPSGQPPEQDAQHASEQASGRMPEQTTGQTDTPQTAGLPLLSPIRRTAQCPAALPPQADRRCAEAVALLEALNAAVAALPQHRELRMGITVSRQYPALASALYATLVEPADGEDKSAPARQRVTVTLLARPNAAARLTTLLRNPDALLLRQLLLEEYAAAAATARELASDMAAEAAGPAEGAAPVPPGAGGTWYVARATQPGQLTQYAPQPAPAVADAQPTAARPQAEDAAEAFTNKLEATSAALDAVEVSSEGWLTRADALASLQQAAQRQPHSAAIRALLAEAQLQAGLPQRCVDSCTEALGLMPGLTRARYIRALAHWRLQQLALAEDDLSVALEKTPGSPLQTSDRSRLLRTRGAVRMLRDDVPGMCADLAEACGMGDCEGLAAAREQHFCVPPLSAPASAPTANAPPSPAAAGQKGTP